MRRYTTKAFAVNTTHGRDLPFVLHDDIILIIHPWEMQPDVVVFHVKATLISVWLPFL